MKKNNKKRKNGNVKTLPQNQASTVKFLPQTGQAVTPPPGEVQNLFVTQQGNPAPPGVVNKKQGRSFVDKQNTKNQNNSQSNQAQI